MITLEYRLKELKQMEEQGIKPSPNYQKYGRAFRPEMKPRLKWHLIGIWAYTNESIFSINSWSAREIRYYADFVDQLNSYVIKDAECPFNEQS